MGDAALLAEVDTVDDVLALSAMLRERVAAGQGVWRQVEDLVPAARTVLLVVTPGTDLTELGRQVLAAADGLDRAAPPALHVTPVTIPVRYDGPDLAAVAALTGLSEAEVVAAHTGSTWRVAFAGFAPGFAYLVGGDPRLRVSRRADPRTAVPAGSVGLAGEFSGVYPRESPGGWQLIGRTAVVLWDVDADPPALLQPGAQVRFVATESGLP